MISKLSVNAHLRIFYIFYNTSVLQSIKNATLILKVEFLLDVNLVSNETRQWRSIAGIFLLNLLKIK